MSRDQIIAIRVALLLGVLFATIINGYPQTMIPTETPSPTCTGTCETATPTMTPLPIMTDPNQPPPPVPSPEPTVTPQMGHFFCWAYVRIYDSGACDYCELESHAVNGSLVEILKDRHQDYPTGTEALSYAVCQVELTQAEIDELRTKMYEAQEEETTFSLFSSNLYAQESGYTVAYKYKFDKQSLKDLGIDTKGIKKDYKKEINDRKKMKHEKKLEKLKPDKTKEDKDKLDKEIADLQTEIEEITVERYEFRDNFRLKVKKWSKKDIDDWKKEKNK